MSKEYEKIRKYRIKKCRTELSKCGFEKSINVLEIGSGDGEETKWCVTLGGNCIATEISVENCRAINKKLKQEKLQLHASVVRSAGEYLPFREGIFDIVFGKAVLHHIRQPLKAISEMRRVANDHGVIAAIDDPNALNPFWHLAKFVARSKSFKNILSPFFSGYYWEWDPVEHPFEDWATPFYPWQLQDLFKKADLKQTKVRNIWQPYYIKYKWFFKIYLVSEKMLEKTPVAYMLGQLFVIGKK